MNNTRKDKTESRKKYINFLTNEDRDADILKWLEAQDNKSEAIRAAIRLAMRGEVERPEITLQDIYQELQDIKRNGFIMRDDKGDYDEPADVAANLENLGL